MNIVQIINEQRQPLAQIKWEPPDKITLEIFASEYEASLTNFVENAWLNGVPFRTGHQVSEDGRVTFVEEKVTIKAGDKRFPLALADVIRNYMLGGQRIFGLIK
jgi:hypothetical protein